MSSEASRATFFRQSGWMMMATVASGVFMFAVHLFSKKIPADEYGVLGTLLILLYWITIPTLGLQMVFAQQASAALTDEQRRQLTGTTRAVLRATFYLWLAIAAMIYVRQAKILATLQITNPAALWITALVGLTMLWLPILLGVLQGQQNFLWLGWAQIFSGLGRFLFAAVFVLFFYGYAAGIMLGALAGSAIALVVALWQSRSVWRGPESPFDWRGWLVRVVPLTLGLGAGQYIFSADLVVVQSHFPKDQTGAYVAAGTLARGLVTFTAPLAAVMFPKVVRSVARAEKTDVMALALLVTALMSGLAALALTLFSSVLLRLVFKASFLPIAPLISWFAWCMVPLTLANVLINNLLARGRYAAVPWLVAVAIGYGFALGYFHDTFLTVVKTLGVFNLLLLAVAAWFTWASKSKSQTALNTGSQAPDPQ